ncbi:conserved hypothetical protein [Hyella patelloides LEGE 07179]|uniref:Uncharacterized protein n=1 Tax=Hyella patelloides LEGE 07179 TaxID=945734 RepID=A0A563W0E2_9CYAN|nr:hypothetical protein [Hyella patelloides]VEP17130.1 conserved hypothetical protein [Hyella patelloides LEGE 07179]
MPKITLCNRCSLDARSNSKVCGIHPEGVNDNYCIDYIRDPDIKEEEQWSPFRLFI